MARACWQGGGALLLVWGISRIAPRLGPDLRMGLWRLAYLKLLALLLWTGSVALPLLPADSSLEVYPATPTVHEIRRTASPEYDPMSSPVASRLGLVESLFLLWL